MSDKKSRGFQALALVAAGGALFSLIWPIYIIRVITLVVWTATIIVGILDD